MSPFEVSLRALHLVKAAQSYPEASTAFSAIPDDKLRTFIESVKALLPKHKFSLASKVLNAPGRLEEGLSKVDLTSPGSMRESWSKVLPEKDYTKLQTLEPGFVRSVYDLATSAGKGVRDITEKK